MITRIGRPYWIAAHLVLLALAATFAANAVSSIVRGRLSRSVPSAHHAETGDANQVKTRPLADYLAIAQRNLFAEVPASEPVVSGAAVGSGPASVQLLGTGSYGEQRYAIIEDTASKEQKMLRLGDSLGDAEVVEIGWRRIVLRRGGQEETLVVPPNLGIAGGTTPPKTTAVSTTTGTTTPDDSQIRKIGEDRWLVSQAEVQHSLDNLSELFTQMRAVPNMQDGKTNGFRVFAIRPNSLFQKIGLQNNDVVQRVNGIELTDPARAMSLFQELQGETRLNVDILRGSETRTLSYEIR